MVTIGALVGKKMAKRSGGRPKSSERDDIVVKLDRRLAAEARYIAETRGISLAEYLTEALRPIVARDFQKAPKPGEGKS